LYVLLLQKKTGGPEAGNVEVLQGCELLREKETIHLMGMGDKGKIENWVG
jgi:hypothetical protein